MDSGSMHRREENNNNNNSKSTSMSPTQRSLSPVRRKTRQRTKEEGSSSSEEVEHALNWLYTRDSTIKDAKYFKKLNKMIPLKSSNNNYEDRAHDLAETLTWMRQNKRRERHQMELSCNTTMTI